VIKVESPDRGDHKRVVNNPQNAFSPSFRNNNRHQRSMPLSTPPESVPPTAWCWDRLTPQKLATDPIEAARRVQQLVLETMPSQRPTLVGIAARCDTSPRTLQRILAKGGQSFEAIVEHTRTRRAHEMIRGGDHSLIEIAFLLAYSDQAHFTRAFVRWTGMTPKACQRLLGPPISGQRVTGPK
jgi:AraC-like DNA-binding protein